MKSRLRLLCCAIVAAMPIASAADPSAVIPVEDFFAPPAIAQARISPDGLKIAYLAPMQGRRGIALFDVATGKSEVLVRAADEDIESFFWKGNDYLVYSADVGGNEADAVQSIHLKTRRVVRLIESFGENNYTRQWGQYGYVLSTWPTNPRRVVVFGGQDANSNSVDYYSADVATGRRDTVLGQTQRDRARSLQTVFDQNGKLRVRVIMEDDHVAVQARLGTSNTFSTLFQQPRDLLLSGLPEARILADNRTLVFVDYRAHDRGALVQWDLDTGRQTGVLFEPPEGEITDVHASRSLDRVLGVTYEAEKPKKHWIDETWRRLQAGIDDAFPGMVNRIVSASDDEKRLVVHVSSDREPGVYLLLDRSVSPPRLMPIGSTNPKLDPKRMTPVQPISFAARDGLQLHGYLTAAASPAAGPQPLIILPHGGPYGVRDSWGYDGEVQFLASRGYAVLQVNYRGSGGYGRKFLEAGRGEWGARMQDDLTDAVQWAIGRGIADPKRIAIYGASYGGYAALAGVAFTPDLYRCAVNYVGVADLALLGERDRGGSRKMNELFYDRWLPSGSKLQHDRSPLHAVAAIKVPTLHAYGENDPRVEIRHWKRLRAELDRLGKPYEVLRERDEGHGFAGDSSRVQFYRTLEQFLARHLK